MTSFLRRRKIYSAANSASAPTPPTPAPTPIPTLAPVVRPSLLELEVAEVAEVAGVAEVEEVEAVSDVVVSVATEVDVEEGVGVATFMFQPTTPIAPTVELRDNVVVAVSHAVESSEGVDA